MIGVVLNPHARGVKRSRDLQRQLSARLGRRGTVIATHTPKELALAARRFADERVELVATCGGDGTNLATLTELVRAYGADRLPRVAFLRGGTVNTVAQNLGIGGDPSSLLDRLCDRVDAGAALPTVEQDLLSVNGMYGFLFASGMGARFLQEYYDGPLSGPAWAGLLAARTVGSSLVRGGFSRRLFQPVKLDLTVDGRPPLASERYRFLVASTVPDVGIGMKVAWRAGLEPGRFHLVASGLSTTKMALQVHRVMRGRPLSGQPHVDQLARAAEVSFFEPQTFTFDGELFSASKVSLAIGPRLRVVRL